MCDQRVNEYIVCRDRNSFNGTSIIHELTRFSNDEIKYLILQGIVVVPCSE